MRKKLVTFLSTCILALSIGTPVFATDFYSANVTYPFAGSMGSSVVLAKTTSAQPFFLSDYQFIPTVYFLSTTRHSSIVCTNYVTTTDTQKHYFSYVSGYGGIGTSYCISAYPKTMDLYTPYRVQGRWQN